jgi:hypothetical protein
MTEIAISDEYKRSFNRLTETERFRVSQLMNEIQYDCVSNGSRPEQLQCLDGKVLKSYRVNDDLRLILYKWRKDGWLAITCGHHDETYNRVKKMRLSAQKEAELPVVKIVVEERKIVEYKPASLTQEVIDCPSQCSRPTHLDRCRMIHCSRSAFPKVIWLDFVQRQAMMTYWES